MPERWCVDYNEEQIRQAALRSGPNGFVGFLEFNPSVFGIRNAPQIMDLSSCGGYSIDESELRALPQQKKKNSKEDCELDIVTMRQMLGLDAQTTHRPHVRMPMAPVHAVARGKELAVAIGELVMVIHFFTEGHLLVDYTSNHGFFQTIVPCGEKGKSFQLPSDLEDPTIAAGPKRHARKMWTIVGRRYTISGVDHQAFMTARLGRMRRTVETQDLRPGSALWDTIWDAGHGPDWFLEKEKAVEQYDSWALTFPQEESRKPILDVITGDQQTFNGMGAWMATDLLARCCIHPLQPASAVKRSKMFISRIRAEMLKMAGLFRPAFKKPEVKWVYVFMPKGSPYSFCEHAHRSWSGAVWVYRRTKANLSPEQMELAPLGYLDPRYNLHADGEATIDPSKEHLEPRHFLYRDFPIHVYRKGSGKYYTYIQAAPPREWYDGVSIVEPDDDVFGNGYLNKSTLGPYSFELFVKSRLSKTKPQRGRPAKLKTGSRGGPKSEHNKNKLEAYARSSKRRRISYELGLELQRTEEAHDDGLIEVGERDDASSFHDGSLAQDDGRRRSQRLRKHDK